MTTVDDRHDDSRHDGRRLHGSRPSTLGLGLAWLALGVPVGALIGWLSRISDHDSDRRYGAFLLVLALLALAVGVAVLLMRTPWLRAASLVLSAGWVVAGVVAATSADFTADKVWGAGLTGLVAVVTAVAALRAPVVVASAAAPGEVAETRPTT